VFRVTSIELKLTVRKLQKQLADRDAAIADRDAKIDKLMRDVALLQDAIKHLFAQRRSSHRIPEAQGLLFPAAEPSVEPVVEAATDDDEGQADGDGEDEDDSPRRKSSGKRTPRKLDTTGLPREDRVHELPEELRVDPVSGQPLVQIGEDVFEELDYQRAQLTVICHRRPVYGLPPQEAELRTMDPVMADLPPRPLENCAASATLLAWLLVQKYANHLPLYRQEAIFGRDGRRLSRRTLCDWVLASAELLQPIVDCLLAKIRAGPVMQLDDTPVMCQGGRGEPNFQAYLWTFVNPEVGGVAYRFTPGRASDPLAKELGKFQGTLVGDGYSGNSAAAGKSGGDIAIAGCWAHVTRKFRDATKEAPATAKLFRDDIKKLYEIEREADEAELGPVARAALRQQKSLPILLEIFSRAWRLGSPCGEFSEAGLMAKAIGYLRNQHRPLRRFLEDGRVPIDNNACERAIRPIAIGRKNWLFAGSMRGGRAAAAVYTLIECCRLAAIEPVSYLADVLVRIAVHPASRVDDLLPANWATTVADRAAPSAAETVLT
jgi:transposase